MELRDRDRVISSPASPARCAGPPSATSWTTRAASVSASASAPRGSFGFAAADGQMGQIMHAYLDWRLSGDIAWLRGMWPRIKEGHRVRLGPRRMGCRTRTASSKACSTTPTTWSSMARIRICGIFYLGALRAGEEMARAARRRRQRGGISRAVRTRQPVDRRQSYSMASSTSRKSAACPRIRSRPTCAATWARPTPRHPEYQVGGGCLLDQLIGQYLADVAGLGPLVSAGNIRKTLDSIWRYNYKRTLEGHESVQRTYVLNDEPALMVCDYGKAARPHVPFPYYAEVVDGLGILWPPALCSDSRHDARGRGSVAQRARALRWRAAQSVERTGMRPPLRAGDGRVDKRRRTERILVSCCGRCGGCGAPPSASHLRLLLGNGNRMGNVFLSSKCERWHALQDRGSGGPTSVSFLRDFCCRITSLPEAVEKKFFIPSRHVASGLWCDLTRASLLRKEIRWKSRLGLNGVVFQLEHSVMA